MKIQSKGVSNPAASGKLVASAMQWSMMLLVFSMVTAAYAVKASGLKDTTKVSDCSENVRILPLDSAKTDSSGTGRMIPLPRHTHLKPSLIHPDSIKARVAGEIFRLGKGDLVSDSGDAGADQGSVNREFQAYWKKVEASSTYRQFRNQTVTGFDVKNNWIPKVLLFDSTVIVIPGYIFLRFR